MSFLTTVAKINTANQITAWQVQCKQAMELAKQSFTSIVVQKKSMETNTDYNNEDLEAIQEVIIELNTIAKELTAEAVSPSVVTPVEPVV